VGAGADDGAAWDEAAAEDAGGVVEAAAEEGGGSEGAKLDQRYLIEKL
jgi:hypothetical protein